MALASDSEGLRQKKKKKHAVIDNKTLAYNF